MADELRMARSEHGPGTVHCTVRGAVQGCASQIAFGLPLGTMKAIFFLASCPDNHSGGLRASLSGSHWHFDLIFILLGSSSLDIYFIWLIRCVLCGPLGAGPLPVLLKG